MLDRSSVNAVRAEGKELSLGTVPSKSLDAAFEEVRAVATLLSTGGVLAEAFAHDFEVLAVELLHWMYDTTNTYKSITDIVFESLEAANTAAGRVTKLDA